MYENVGEREEALQGEVESKRVTEGVSQSTEDTWGVEG